MYKIYIFFAFIYNSVFSNYENFFFLKKKIQSQFYQRGYEKKKFNKLKNFFFLDFNLFHKKKVNPYMYKIIVNENKIISYLKYLFNQQNLKKIITNMTGFEYSIDFFIAYRTLPIKKKDLLKGWYANHWHKDLPFTENTLKILIPVSNLKTKKDGGMEIMDINDTKKFEKKSNLNLKTYTMIADKGEFFIFYPNKCYHKAGELGKNKFRDQIMIQLNPSKKWNINNNIYKKQFFMEPKFPFFSYFFDKRKYL